MGLAVVGVSPESGKGFLVRIVWTVRYRGVARSTFPRGAFRDYVWDDVMIMGSPNPLDSITGRNSDSFWVEYEATTGTDFDGSCSVLVGR